MGRGQRGSDKAVQLSALPRRLKKPDYPGQRRYHVEHIDDKGKSHRDPGYLRGELMWLKVDYRHQIGVREEVALTTGEGKLDWFPGSLVYSEDFTEGVSDVEKMRKIAKHLNNKPLGPTLEQRVDQEGNVVIDYHQRSFNSTFWFGRSDQIEQSIDYRPLTSGGLSRFDVSDPSQKAAAQQLYQDLAQQLNEDRLQQVEQVKSKILQNSDNEKVKDLLRSPDERQALAMEADKIKEKSEQTEEFIEALASGKMEEFERNQAAEQAANKRQEQADRKRAAKKSAQRMQETINSLRHN